jgi:uncharacterized membrane protein YoaK (UPF0700 family)
LFKHQGPSRSSRQNGVLAAYLALVGGFVNSAGFVLIGSFTSHITGNVGRLANDVASLEWSAAASTSAMIVAFFCGSFVASMIIESEAFGRAADAYGTSQALEALLLLGFLATFTGSSGDRLRSLEGATLCAAMGVQNSLVTRLSGAVVRTTHLTGVVTDLGIESAGWFRWLRGRASDAWKVKLSFGATPPKRPSVARIGLLGIIAAAFTGGAIAGAAGATRFRQMALVLPLASLVAGAAYAFASGRSRSSDRHL